MATKQEEFSDLLEELCSGARDEVRAAAGRVGRCMCKDVEPATEDLSVLVLWWLDQEHKIRKISVRRPTPAGPGNGKAQKKPRKERSTLRSIFASRMEEAEKGKDQEVGPVGQMLRRKLGLSTGRRIGSDDLGRRRVGPDDPEGE